MLMQYFNTTNEELMNYKGKSNKCTKNIKKPVCIAWHLETNKLYVIVHWHEMAKIQHQWVHLWYLLKS